MISFSKLIPFIIIGELGSILQTAKMTTKLRAYQNSKKNKTEWDVDDDEAKCRVQTVSLAMCMTRKQTGRKQKNLRQQFYRREMRSQIYFLDAMLQN